MKRDYNVTVYKVAVNSNITINIHAALGAAPPQMKVQDCSVPMALPQSCVKEAEEMPFPDIQEMIRLVWQTRPLIMDTENARHITIKGQADFVTRVDTHVQAYLKEELFKLNKNIQFMGEENHLDPIDPGRPSWILDPIDGTTNLIYDYHHSAVSLGYYDGKTITAGVIYNPFTEETFYGASGQGAFLNGHPIHVTDHKTLSKSLISIGTSPYDKELAAENFTLFLKIFKNTLDIRRSGSAALDLAYVACGRLDGYIERNLKPWDFAAGAIILQEAGGSISGYDGSPLTFYKNQDITADNGAIHKELLSMTVPFSDSAQQA